MGTLRLQRQEKAHVNHVARRQVTRAVAISRSCRTDSDVAAATSVKQSMMGFWQEFTNILVMLKAPSTTSKFRTWCKNCSYFFSFSRLAFFFVVVMKCLTLRGTEPRSGVGSERQHKLLPHISMNINCLLSKYLIVSFQFIPHEEQRWHFFFLLLRLGEWQQTRIAELMTGGVFCFF